MITVRMQHGDTTVALLPEEIDYDNASLVGAQCGDLIRQGCRTLILDASTVKYLDSSAISTFILLLRLLDDHDGTLRLAALDDHYRHNLRILGLDSLFPLYPTVEAAHRPYAISENTEMSQPSRSA
ncbi:anti-sigma factor antagonist [Streptomyces dangxiongensis]|uniref:Anti-sigma factor antagonist n=1 Tax=Streptomyces dangxiongensis TaxID=1442032 RepID=A0A3G2JPU7_9ACTN|nr:STAS domain-containing protein [Streptomyces dangxiongensis]AYN42759.1 anti-sigma factor antagonist [Streptomyces dangxiongensis]